MKKLTIAASLLLAMSAPTAMAAGGGGPSIYFTYPAPYACSNPDGSTTYEAWGEFSSLPAGATGFSLQWSINQGFWQQFCDITSGPDSGGNGEFTCTSMTYKTKPNGNYAGVGMCYYVNGVQKCIVNSEQINGPIGPC